MDESAMRSDGAPAVTPGPWQEPVRGGHPPAHLAAVDGAAQLRAIVTGDAPAPPLSHLTGMAIERIGDGEADFSMPMTPWLAGPDGEIPLGPLTIPTDGAMACAIIAGLPPHTGLTTIELSLRRLRPAPPGQRLVAHGRLVDWGDGVALSEASLLDEAGQLIAQAGSLCVTLPMAAEPVASAPAPAGTAGALASAGTAAPASVASTVDPGATRRDPWQREGAPPDGLAALTGLRTAVVADGGAEAWLPASPWLCAPPPGRAQGGTVAILAEAALTAAIGAGAPAGVRFATTELKLNYLRPLTTDGRIAHAHGRLVHRGRRTAVAEARVTDADGRLIALATGSALAVTPR